MSRRLGDARSTILTQTPRDGDGMLLPEGPSSTERLSDVVSVPVTTDDVLDSSIDRSLGALRAMRLFLASFAARTPILTPAHTPRATPPPISTAELKIAP